MKRQPVTSAAHNDVVDLATSRGWIVDQLSLQDGSWYRRLTRNSRTLWLGLDVLDDESHSAPIFFTEDPTMVEDLLTNDVGLTFAGDLILRARPIEFLKRDVPRRFEWLRTQWERLGAFTLKQIARYNHWKTSKHIAKMKLVDCDLTRLAMIKFNSQVTRAEVWFDPINFEWKSVREVA